MKHQDDSERSAKRRSAIKFVVVVLLLWAAAGLYALRSWRTGEDHLPALTTETFDETVASGVVLVDFWAPWCGPCRQQGPILVDVAERVEGRAAVVKVNVDEQGALAERFAVRSVPTLIILRDGQPVERFVGVQDAETLIDAIDRAAAADAPSGGQSSGATGNPP